MKCRKILKIGVVFRSDANILICARKYERENFGLKIARKFEYIMPKLVFVDKPMTPESPK